MLACIKLIPAAFSAFVFDVLAVQPLLHNTEPDVQLVYNVAPAIADGLPVNP